MHGALCSLCLLSILTLSSADASNAASAAALVDGKGDLFHTNTPESNSWAAVSPQTSVVDTVDQTNPITSTLSRDSLLAYAYHLYYSTSHSLTAGLTAMPLSHLSSDLTSSQDIYRIRLLPLLVSLRSLHPRDIPILLLLACTHHTLGDYDSSLTVSREILDIDPTFVSSSSWWRFGFVHI